MSVFLFASGCASVPSDSTSDPLGAYRSDTLAPAGDISALIAAAQAQRELQDLLQLRVWYPQCLLEPGGMVFDPACLEGLIETAAAEEMDRLQVTGSRISASDLITNVQTAGIDEGGIVKRVGDVLVVLRGSRLHTLVVHEDGHDVLRHVQAHSVVDDESVDEIWFDEMLAFDGGVLLLAYNYGEELIELFTFSLSAAGELIPIGRVQILGEDYFSGTNYGTRLFEGQLLMSTTVSLSGHRDADWPMWRKFDPQGSGQWQMLIEPENVRLPVAPFRRPTVHAVLFCSIDLLMEQRLDCRTEGLVAERYAELYVSHTAAYLAVNSWTDEAYFQHEFSPLAWHWGKESPERLRYRQALVFRVPLAQGQPPAVVSIPGVLGDQFSLVEVDDSLFVVTETSGAGGERRLEVNRVLFDHFADRPPGRSRTMASLEVSERHRTVRITGQHLFIGEHSLILREEEADWHETAFIVQPVSGRQHETIYLPHTVDRIEVLDNRIFLSGQDAGGNWAMRLVDASRSDRFASQVVLHDYISSEDRSHAFNWRRMDNEQLIMGLPGVPAASRPDGDEWRWLENRVSDLVFLTASDLELEFAGALDMQDVDHPGEDCTENNTCWDWYGNARVFFIDGRIFALSADRLVEGRLGAGQVYPLQAITLED